MGASDVEKKVPWYYRVDWGTQALVWWLSLGSMLGLYALAVPEGGSLAFLLTPAIQGAIIGIAVIAMHFYTRQQRRRAIGNKARPARRRSR